MLIRNFCTPTETGTDCAWLCADCNGSKDCSYKN